ncbi:hypothetical protein JOY44_23605 [Phormidium sp. CLA17]|uniref:hypothetical protein n=1 Tax=Leptolyngbya sp. Cla-17 TaxID=2803751 RepID=UPI001490F64A|nr:hypothetical protein [Leptolyngbya sp. Cla-17]MBM0744557.1 hypothetical protein [Leptolyngbya sp. Cla-17]
MPDDLAPKLGSEAPYNSRPIAAVSPGEYAAPAQFLEIDSAELEMLSQLAAQLLNDPLAVQRLSDRVVELMQQDLKLQQERDRGYGRRW